MSTSMQPPYGEDVVGKRCSVMFQVDKNRLEPYTGKITKFEATLEDEEASSAASDNNAEETIVRRHYMVFDDGDEMWFDLESEKQNGRLKWLAEKRPRSIGHSSDDHHHHQAQEPRSPKNAAAVTAGTMTNRVPDEVSSLGFGQDGPSSDDESTTKKVAAAVQVTPPRKLKKPRTATTIITPAAICASKKKKTTRKQLPLTAEQNSRLARCDRWIESMALWLEYTPHGPQNKTTSSTNAKSVLRQVKKLVSGQGVSYAHWPEEKIFYENKPIDLEHTDFSKMLQEAKAYERAYGKDLGNGWLLQHPIKKLLLFQEYYHYGD